MNCNELRDSYELYAIGVADDPERSEIREHLNRECEVCMQGIRQARELAALLGGTAAPAAPSPKLRGRILEIGSEIREHLNRECEVCMQGIRQARELAALLGGTAAPAAPSPKLRGRIL